jgi:ribosomal protein S12 methylthiotransferase accessory factor
MSLTVSHVNHSRPIVKPLLSHAEAQSLQEVEQLYGPNSVLRVLTTYFRSGPGAELHVGHGQYFDFDYIVSRLLEICPA